MVFDEFCSGCGFEKSIEKLSASSSLIRKNTAFTKIDELHGEGKTRLDMKSIPDDISVLINLFDDVRLKCEKNLLEEKPFSENKLHILCRNYFHKQKEKAIIIVFSTEEKIMNIKLIFKGKIPSKNAILAGVMKNVMEQNNKYAAIAHNLRSAICSDDVIIANELFSKISYAGKSLRDFLVISETDCYSVKDMYKDFWHD